MGVFALGNKSREGEMGVFGWGNKERKQEKERKKKNERKRKKWVGWVGKRRKREKREGWFGWVGKERTSVFGWGDKNMRDEWRRMGETERWSREKEER